MRDKIALSPGVYLKRPIPRPEYYILHDHITLGQKLGAGAFGEVFAGKLTVSKPTPGKPDEITNDVIPVAVKRLKGTITKTQLQAFVKEAKMMRKLDHPNIVRLHGIAPQEEPVMTVLELAEGGSLKGYCSSHPTTLPAEKLLGFARDAARGMCYLAACRIIHRDLAARNCLLGKKLELKISDFGLSISGHEEVRMEKLKSMPIKWLAPETLNQGIFSHKTDVWTFGVLLWEIYAKCKTDPFPGETNQEARIKILSGKDPMEPPEGSPDLISKTMKQCFTQDPTQRPDFETIFLQLAPDEEPPKPKAEQIVEKA